MQLVLSTPTLYCLELTPLCNSRCLGCFNAFIDDGARPTHDVPSPLPIREWHIILRKIQPHAQRIKLSGGEPTLHPDFEAIISTIDELGIPYSVFTNGRWQRPEQLVHFLRESPGCVGLLISLHGARAESHEAYTGVCLTFDETVANIGLAVEIGLPVATSTVITRQNYQEIGDIIALSAQLGADHAVINRYLGPRLPELEPTDEQLKIVVREVDRLKQAGARVKFGNCIPLCFMDNSSTGCLAGVAYCTVDPWGSVRPCNHSPSIVGNLLHQSVEEAWQSETMDAWRGLMPDECESCAVFSVCHGGCRALIEVRGTERRDPLRRAPIRLGECSSPQQQVALYEGLYPLARGFTRPEAFGFALMSGNRVVPLTAEDKVVYDACDGVTTLQGISEQFGARGLSLVAQLSQKGFVELCRQPRDRALPSRHGSPDHCG